MGTSALEAARLPVTASDPWRTLVTSSGRLREPDLGERSYMTRVQWFSSVPAAVLAALLALSSCARHGASAYAIPALSLQPTGNVEGYVEVPERALYAVSLRYEVASPEERRTAWKVAERAPFDVAITLKTPAGGTAVDATFESPRMTSFVEGELEAELTRLELTPGRYEIVARSLNGSLPKDVPIKIAVAPAYVGK